MPSTTRISKHPSNQIPEQQETQARDGSGNSQVHASPTNAHIPPSMPCASANCVGRTHGLVPPARPQPPACRAPAVSGALRRVHTGLTGPEAPREGDDGLKGVPDTDRPLVEAMGFFETPSAQPPLPYEQMIYTPLEDVHTFRILPHLPVIPTSLAASWHAVQFNLTHDGALGAAMVAILAADTTALAGLIRRGDKPGHYVVTLKLPTRHNGTLDIISVVDAAVPATAGGRVLGWAGQGTCSVLWPLMVAKAIGKLVQVLRATGHLPPHHAGEPLTYAHFCSWLTGYTPQPLTTLRAAVLAANQSARRGLALQAPADPGEIGLPGGTLTSALGGMAHRLRSHAGDIDVLLLNGHHYGVIKAELGKSVRLYNPLGFNPHPHLADTHDAAFFDPHSLSDGERAGATIILPATWLEAIGCLWFS